MLMLFACLATFLLASSKEARLCWDIEGGGLLVMVGSGSSVDRGPIFDKAAVMVAMKKRRLKQEPIRKQLPIETRRSLLEIEVQSYQQSYWPQRRSWP